MGIGGIGGGGEAPRFGSEEVKDPSGIGKSFQLPSLNWKETLSQVAEEIHPDNPQDVQEAMRALLQVTEDPSVPQPVKNVARQVSEQIEQGYMVSRNPIELVEPYLSLCSLTQPIGPGPFPGKEI